MKPEPKEGNGGLIHSFPEKCSADPSGDFFFTF